MWFFQLLGLLLALIGTRVGSQIQPVCSVTVMVSFVFLIQHPNMSCFPTASICHSLTVLISGYVAAYYTWQASLRSHLPTYLPLCCVGELNFFDVPLIHELLFMPLFVTHGMHLFQLPGHWLGCGFLRSGSSFVSTCLQPV